MASLVQVVEYERVVQYIAVSGATMFVYDYVLTLRSEISLMWTSWGGWVGRLVFFFTRYSPIVGLPVLLIDLFASTISSRGQVESLRGAATVLQFALSLSTTGIFCLRMCTLYHRERQIVLFITVFYFSSALIQLILGIIALKILIPLTGSIEGHCGIMGETRNLHKIVAGSYLSMMPCEIVILSATVVHSVRARRLHLLDGASATLPILTRLYRDGMAYFGLALALRLCGAIVWLEAPAGLKLSADYCVYSLTSIFSYRFFLGLRESISRTSVARSRSSPMPTTDTFALPERPRHSLYLLSMRKDTGQQLEADGGFR